MKLPTLQILLCAVVTHSLLSVKVCLGLAIFLRTLVRKSWSTVSNSPGALCRISSSVAGLIPGERTSATPRSVLQISDRHLRRYPILPTCHVMVSMALTNQRRSSQGRKTSYGHERAVDLSTARLSGPWTNPRPARKTSKGRC